MSIGSADYEILVAAHLLRNKAFIVKNAHLMEGAAEMFFGHFAVQDIVKHGLLYHRSTGKLLPAAALKSDMARLRREGSSVHTYDHQIDRIFAVSLDGEEHVQKTLVTEMQVRMLDAMACDKNALAELLQSGEYFKAMREVEAVGAGEEHNISHITDKLDDLLFKPPQGISTGFEPLDRCMDCNGVGPGEMFLVIGDPNVGKTQFLHHLVREAALRQQVRTFVVSHETSHRNTRLRILRGAVGWPRERAYADPEGFKEAVEALGDIPIHVRYAPGGGLYTPSSMAADIDRIQQTTGDKVGFVVRDYGEKAVANRGNWQEILTTYADFRDKILGPLGIAGADACQRNRGKEISNFDLIKDVDIGLELSEQRPGGAILDASIRRIREGERGSFTFRVERATGRVELHGINVEDLEVEE